MEQYVSTMLDGRCPRLRLIWQMNGCASFEQWVEERPEEAKIARSEILMVMLLVRRRYQDTLYRWPFRLFAVADARRQDHEALLRDFYSQPSCCREPGFARELRDFVSYDELVADLPRW